MNIITKSIIAIIALSVAFFSYAEESGSKVDVPLSKGVPFEVRKLWDRIKKGKIGNKPAALNRYGSKKMIRFDVSKKYDKDKGVVYLYLYLVSVKNGHEFQIDVDCPESPAKQMNVFHISSFPAQRISTEDETNRHRVTWTLKSDSDNDGVMWFFSTNQPVEREYTVVTQKPGWSRRRVSGGIAGPDCPRIF